MVDQHQSGSAHAAHDASHDEHHGGMWKYVWVFVALTILTTASILTYTPWWNEVFSRPVAWSFMMAVSCGKALLVMLFFMHLLWEANWKYVLTFPAAFMSIFLIGMLVPDIGMRTEKYSPERWRYAALAEEPEAHDGEHEAGEERPEHNH